MYNFEHVLVHSVARNKLSLLKVSIKGNIEKFIRKILPLKY